MNYILRLKGGAGSGHHGHRGRPGFEGGSLPRNMLSLSTEISTNDRGVKVRSVAGIGPVDAGIADTLEKIISLGYKTAQSCSGLVGDHKSPRNVSTGYIAFWKHDNTKNQIENIKNAAVDSGLNVQEEDCFFLPAVEVYTPYANDMTSHSEITAEANRLANMQFNISDATRDLETDDFLHKWLPAREKYSNNLIEQHGGRLLDDNKVSELWKKFINNLEKYSQINKEFILKGGAGSGNHDHKGIPGHQGGSLPKYEESKKKYPPDLQALIDYRDEDKRYGDAEREYERAVSNIAFDISEKVRRRDAVGLRRDYRKMVMEYEKLQSHKFREQEIDDLIEALKKIYFVKSRK